MWKRIVHWSLLVAAVAFASGLAVQIAKPPFPAGWSDQVTAVLAGLKFAVGVSLLLALFAHLMGNLFPARTGPLVMDSRFWLRAAFVMGAMNFLVFAFVAAAIGGDALNGSVEHGRYFLHNRGVVTEVSRSVFFYSKWHAISTYITHPLAIVAAWMLHWDSAQDSY
jgi:hypothetical protein